MTPARLRRNRTQGDAPVRRSTPGSADARLPFAGLRDAAASAW